MTERAVPFHCPYCGEQDLWPFETPRSSAPQEPPREAVHGAWECRGCLRAFTVKMLGMVRPQGVER
jgi:hypothetical protein